MGKVIWAERECSRKLSKPEEGEAFEEFKGSKREARKVISKTWGEAIDGLFQKLGHKKGKKKYVN